MTVFGGKPVSVIAVVEEEVYILIPFLFENGESWTDVTGISRFDGKDGIRICHSERARALGSTATGGVDA